MTSRSHGLANVSLVDLVDEQSLWAQQRRPFLSRGSFLVWGARRPSGVDDW